MQLPDKFTIIIPPQDIAGFPGCLTSLANGDRAAFGWLYRNYCRKVYDYAMLMTNNEHLSEDIVQDVFCKIWQHREKLKVVGDFNAYLYMLYKNHVLDVLRGNQRETRVRQTYFQDTVTRGMLPDEIISHKEMEQAVMRAVKLLPKQQQLVYKLSREQGWKREVIAKELKVSPLTVKGHIQKALGKLREDLRSELE
jgi:RNA polymerase sigma-70 factor (ECF subfamily)